VKRLLIVWHSHTGGAEQMAQAAAEGATRAGEVQVQLRHAPAADAAALCAADGFIFVTPENLASMSGLMKDFFDRSYYGALDRVQGRPYALLVCAGSDGTGAVRQLERIATGLRLRRVAEPIIVLTQAQTPAEILAPKQIAAADQARCRDLGAALAAGLATGVF
jgi:multimeric flavodoxin WrbA